MKHRKLLSVLLVLLLAFSLCTGAFAVNADDGVVTRGEFIAALFELNGEKDMEPRQAYFDDVPMHGELALAVRWAVGSGIVNGYGNGRFGPDDPITREQMATMLFRCAGSLGQTPQGTWLFPLGFADTDQISAYAYQAMQWIVMNRIIDAEGGNIAPKAPATDAQFSLALERWQSFLTPEGQSRGIMVLYTSDVHCSVDEGFGYAGLQEVREALKAQGYDVVLVDDGDNVQGKAIGTLTRGEAPMELMNRMGYDVATPGNHEFSYGMDAFFALTGEAAFDYISCNFNHKGELVLKPYVIRELAGRKVAFVGISTPDTLKSSTPAYFMDENGEYVYGFFQDETGEGVYNAVQSAVDAARAEGAEYVVAMAHLGNQQECSPYTYADIISHTSGIDALLDGHSHDVDQVSMKNKNGDTVLRSACGTKLACIGWCSIAPDGALRTGLYTWNDSVPAGEKLGLDNEMSRAVASVMEKMNEKLGEIVASTQIPLTTSDPVEKDAGGKPIRMVRRAETNLGDLCADAYRDQSGADIAFVNGGGIRADIAVGDITLGDILNVHPYGNSMCVIEVSGRQILDALEWGARSLPGESGGFLQVSGLSYEIRSDVKSPCISDQNGMFVRVEGERRVQNVLVGGVPIDPDRTYTLASHDYMLLDKGDGFTMFTGAPLILNRVKLDNQVLIDYIIGTLGGVIGAEYADPYGQGRIVII